jgi:O-antigen/teichoic acid export membrane protein
MLGASTGLLALVNDFIHLSAAQSYWPALPVVSWLVGSYILQVWGDYFRFGCFYTANNRYITYSSIATVVVITGLYLYLIPQQGALGAGKAMFIASFVRFATIYFWGQKLFRISVPWTRIVGSIAYFSAALYIITLIPLEGVAAMLVKGLAAGIACIAVFATPLIDREHRRALYGQLASITGRSK